MRSSSPRTGLSPIVSPSRAGGRLGGRLGRRLGTARAGVAGAAGLAACAAVAALSFGAIAESRAGAGITGSGKAGSELRTVSSFEAIKLAGAVDLELRIGPQLRVEVIADDNLLRYVTTTVKNKTLTVELARQPGEAIETRSPMKAIITAPMVSAVAVLGSGDAMVTGVTGEQFTMAVSGSGSVRASGKAKRVQAAVDGSGDVRAKELTASSATVAIHGSGDVSVFASESITAAISGSGDVDVYGKPGNVTRVVDGSGEVRLRK